MFYVISFLLTCPTLLALDKPVFICKRLALGPALLSDGCEAVPSNEKSLARVVSAQPISVRIDIIAPDFDISGDNFHLQMIKVEMLMMIKNHGAQ